MKLNNKGMSLMEILVSIVLISTVLTFLVQLLLDLKNETDNNNFAFHNQYNRSEIIHLLQNDLDNYTLLGIEEVTDDFVHLKFHFKDGFNEVVTELSMNGQGSGDDTIYYLKYRDYEGNENAFKMEEAIIDSCGDFNYYIDDEANYYYFNIQIPIYNSNFQEDNTKGKNNHVDDIEISYLGRKDLLDYLNSIYLTKSNKVNKKIGKCTN